MDEDDDMGMPGPSSSSKPAAAGQGRAGSGRQTAPVSGRAGQNRQATLGETFGRSARSTQQVSPTRLASFDIKYCPCVDRIICWVVRIQ